MFHFLFSPPKDNYLISFLSSYALKSMSLIISHYTSPRHKYKCHLISRICPEAPVA